MEVISMRDVSFSYPQSDKQQLSHVDLTVYAGQRVVLVGRTGCGKSTVLRLLLRLSHGNEGRICLFGRPVEQFSRGEMARRIAYGEQGDSVIHGTVRENIVFGLSREVTDAEVVRAAARAELHETVLGMSAGYDTVLRERGKDLSGGQRQRIGLARALLREPELLVLDEPTAALDPQTHHAIQATIASLSGVTIVEVTHRYDGVEDADLIAVMEDGNIVERGTFAELSSADGLFASRLDSQRRDTPPSDT